MAKKPIVTVDAIEAASLTANQAGEFLPIAAAAAVSGKAIIDEGKAKGAAALAVMVAGFASDKVATRKWAFQIEGKAEGDVHHHVQCEGFAEFGNDDLAWKRNSEGAVSKVAQSVYKRALQCEFFNLSDNVPAVWTMASKAIPMARAIREEGMTVRLVDGKLKLSGGNSKRAEAMAEAKTMAALTKAVNGTAGSNGTGGHGAGKGEAGEVTAASPSEITQAAVAIAKIIAKGEATACNATLSNLRAIAKLVADNASLFEGD